ncbi:MAG: hypothetical protein JSR54_12630, partial [Proteobacteria bacterium]|nr:hypothetical protein [Pseudomonadota bacterium]
MTTAIRDVESLRQYLAGRLSAGEADAFEARLAAEPSLVAELEDALRLREGLAL